MYTWVDMQEIPVTLHYLVLLTQVCYLMYGVLSIFVEVHMLLLVENIVNFSMLWLVAEIFWKMYCKVHNNHTNTKPPGYSSAGKGCECELPK